MRPRPANATKHLDELQHPVPGRDGPTLTLKQASSGGYRYIVVGNRAESSASSSSDHGSSGSTGTTGTTLWLGAQVMAAYLFHANILSASRQPRCKRKRAIELGSGVGYLSLCLAHRGWDVVSTDIEPALGSVLRPNIARGREALVAHAAKDGPAAIEGMGDIRVAALDWMDSPPRSAEVQSTSGTDNLAYLTDLVGDGLDVIITTDTIYSPSIIQPLWNTIWHLSILAAQASAAHSASPSAATRAEMRSKQSYPTIYLALENRDPTLIDSALKKGREMGFDMRRIPNMKLAKALGEAKRRRLRSTPQTDGSEEGLGTGTGSEPEGEGEGQVPREKEAMYDGVGWGWEREDWEGVEVWKIRLT